MEYKKFEKEHHSNASELPELPSPEVQNNLFSTWFQSTVLNGPKRNQYKIPFKLTQLPCNCCRERTSESDPNNTWYIQRKGVKFFHKECGI